jgi:hypothetical protein
MTSLKINAPFLELERQPQAADKNAAWELDLERLTRYTQMLGAMSGVEDWTNLEIGD